jgi:uncharacterized protein YecA (UPF0149 family)
MAELVRQGRYADEIMAEYAAQDEARYAQVGRNEPCPCGSGKKYKQCHGRKPPGWRAGG